MATMRPYTAVLLLAFAFSGQLAHAATCVVDSDCNVGISPSKVCYKSTCQPTQEKCDAIGCTEGDCTWCGVDETGFKAACFDEADGSICNLASGGPNVLGSCKSGNCVVSQSNDPVFTGYDGKQFHSDRAGTFAVQEDGEGYKVESTFADGLGDGVERSFTKGVRVFGPNGEMVSCDLPDIKPNTNRVQATKPTNLTPSSTILNLTAMSVTADVSDGTVNGCTIDTPRFQVQVYQVIGSDQAANFDFEAWAAPFTWLNMNLALRKPLIPPVTGILGSTYPKDPAAELDTLHQATVEVSEREGVSVFRRLHGAPEAWLMTAGISD